MSIFDLIVPGLVSILIFFFIIYTHQIIKFLNQTEINYYGIQKIHNKSTSRLGGFVIYGSLIFFYFYSTEDQFLLKYLLISSFPLIVFSISEDIFQNMPPKLRILAIFSSCILFYSLYLDNSFPQIDFPLLNFIHEDRFFSIVFFSFAILSVSNGMNIIDGSNGTCAFTALAQLLSIVFISSIVNDNQLLNLSLILIFFIFIFLIFNYPLGKIFLGDTGAYFLGFASCILTIELYGRNQGLPSWGAILILFYPVIETIFSTIRKKFYEKSSPLEPDPYHLHLKLFFFLKKKYNGSQLLKLNNLIFILLIPICFLPSIINILFYDNLIYIICFIVFFTIFYFLYYLVIPRNN